MSYADATPAIKKAADAFIAAGLTVGVQQGGMVLEVLSPTGPPVQPAGLILLHAGDLTTPWVYADPAAGLQPF